MKIKFCGQEFVLDSSGAAFWPRKDMLIVADAHLEKGSYYAARGFHLPPYDSHATLQKLEEVCGKYMPKQIVILGDFFHDNDAHKRLSPESIKLFDRLQTFPLIWVKGNHDAGYVPKGIEVHDEYECEKIVFRHEAQENYINEISGHYHPKSDFTYKGTYFRGPCFIEDNRKMMLPAFGAYTGGLSVRQEPISRFFTHEARSYVIINDKIVAV